MNSNSHRIDLHMASSILAPVVRLDTTSSNCLLILPEHQRLRRKRRREHRDSHHDVRPDGMLDLHAPLGGEKGGLSRVIGVGEEDSFLFYAGELDAAKGEEQVSRRRETRRGEGGMGRTGRPFGNHLQVRKRVSKGRKATGRPANPNRSRDSSSKPGTSDCRRPYPTAPPLVVAINDTYC